MASRSLRLAAVLASIACIATSAETGGQTVGQPQVGGTPQGQGKTDAEGYKTTDQGPPMLGVEMSPTTLAAQAANNLGMDQGVLVRQVFPNTAAAGMGIQSGDVITDINGAPIGSMTDLRNEVGFNNVGDPVDVVVSRNGQRIPMRGAFQEWPSNIPHEPLDPAVEQRFKDWQRRHLERNQHDVSELRQQLDQLKDDLAQPADATAQAPRPDAAADEVAKLLHALPAWKLGVSYALASDDVVAVGGAPLIAAPVGGEAWRVDYRLDSAAQ